MKIAIDISQIVYGTGVSHYRENLVKNLLKIDGEDEFILFAGTLRRKTDILKIFSTARVFPIPPKLGNIIWNRLHILPIEKLIGEVDVLHTSDWSEPPSKAYKVTTIHDLIPFKFPKIVPKIIRSTHEARLKWVIKESKKIIVPSLNTKKDLMDFGFSESIIRVIPEAPNFTRASEEEINTVKRKYKIFGDYIISVGTKPWKNTERMIKAFHLSKYGKDLKYIIVGALGDIHLKNERGVRLLGNVSDFDLAGLLSGSRGLIFASLYEGLGIPVLDAFNCGVPVVASNSSSLPEVAGDAAAFVDPYDINSIADGIEKILRGPKSFVDKGYKKVKEYSWENTARMTLDVYKEVQK